MPKITKSAFIAFFSCPLLLGCASAYEKRSEMDIQVDVSGNFRGSTNSGMASEDIQSLIQGSVCGPSREISNFEQRTTANSTTFAGTCISA